MAIIGILSGVIIAFIQKGEENAKKMEAMPEKQYCLEKYGDETMEYIPAKCLTYFGIKSVRSTEPVSSDETSGPPPEAYQNNSDCSCSSNY